MLKSTCVDFRGFSPVPRSQGGLMKENGFVFLIGNPARFRGLQQCLQHHYKDLEQCAHETLLPAGAPDEPVSPHGSLTTGENHSGPSHSGLVHSGSGISHLSDGGYHGDEDSDSLRSESPFESGIGPLDRSFSGHSSPGSPKPNGPRMGLPPRIGSLAPLHVQDPLAV